MTPKIELMDLDANDAALLERDPAEFAHRFKLDLDEVRPILPDIAHQTVAVLTRDPRPAPWGAYLAIDRSTSKIVGTCAFKTAPNHRGEVEIAYCTFPPFEGRGMATAMAAALKEIAEGSQGVKTVLAHTLPRENASTRILRKLSFRQVGTVNDPEDGPVWRWELQRSRASPHPSENR